MNHRTCVSLRSKVLVKQAPATLRIHLIYDFDSDEGAVAVYEVGVKEKVDVGKGHCIFQGGGVPPNETGGRALTRSYSAYRGYQGRADPCSIAIGGERGETEQTTFSP